MVAIPYFHSTKPTNTLVMAKVDATLLDKYNCDVKTKFYYKNNRPIVSRVVSFDAVAQAEECREAIMKYYNKQQNTD